MNETMDDENNAAIWRNAGLRWRIAGDITGKWI